MNLTDYELHLLNTKPRFLSDEEKVIRLKCKLKISYNKNKNKILERQKKYYKERIYGKD